MTIMVKTSLGSQKQPGDVMVMPLIDIEEPVRPVNRPRKLPPTPPRRAVVPCRTVLLLGIFALLLTLVGFMGGAIILSDIMGSNAQSSVRYHGTCAVSSTQDMDYVVLKEAPPTASWFGVATPEMRVYSSASDLISDRILNNLLEDMSIEDDVENIYVHDGPRSFHVVHDFNENYTNIITAQRCFLMELLRQFVLEPPRLIASFRNESRLELSHAHTVFAAALPPAPAPLALPAAAAACRDDNKPVYRLTLEGTHVLHKRSVEVRPADEALPAPPAPAASAPPAAGLPHNDFVQFSGAHLQRITINNLDDVIRYEQDNTLMPSRSHPKLSAARDHRE